MQLNKPRPKSKRKLTKPAALPIIKLSNNEIYKFSGKFNGFCVIIEGEDEMQKINSMGCFGKANFSRSYPTFFCKKNEIQIIRKRQFDRRKKLSKKFVEQHKPEKVLVVSDSDSDIEQYFVDLKPEYQIDYSDLKEKVNLSLEEAFFLSHALKCLNISHANSLLRDESLWCLFCKTEKYFVQNYITYYHFRSKNWIVKPGIKFGGDYLLYKDGPAFYHASYVVVVDVLQSHTLERREDLCRRSMSTTEIVGLNRLCESTGKELLICQILWPDDVNICNFMELSKFTVNEVCMKRWILARERENDDEF